MDLNGKRILFLGDSITDFGQYPAMAEAFLRFKNIDATIFNLGVSSENTSGLTEPMHPFPRPNILHRVDRALEAVKPHIVVCLYGINDGIYQPPTAEFKKAFYDGITALHQKLKDYGVYTVMCPPTFFDVASVPRPGKNEEECKAGALYEKYDDLMEEFKEFVLNEIPADGKADVHEAMRAFVTKERADKGKYISGDGIHPHIEGAAKIAEAILTEGFGLKVDLNFLLSLKKFKKLYTAVYRKQMQEHFYWKELVGHENIYKAKPMSKTKLDLYLKKSEKKIAKLVQNAQTFRGKKWNGFLRVDFLMDGKKASVILPNKKNEIMNTVWKPEFLDAFTAVDCKFLQRGYALLYLDMPDLYGSEEAIFAMRSFYIAAQSLFLLKPKVGFIALSRAGLSATRYAAKFPTEISFIYFDAPVFDAESWPGGQGKGEGSADDIIKMANVYQIDRNTLKTVTAKMIEAAKNIAKYKIPVLIVSNKIDPIVPFEENGAKLSDLLNSNAHVILKDEEGHHPHGLGDGSKICDLLEKWII